MVQFTKEKNIPTEWDTKTQKWKIHKHLSEKEIINQEGIYKYYFLESSFTSS